MCLIILFEQTAICTHPPTWNKGTVITLIDPLHLCTALWVRAFRVFERILVAALKINIFIPIF